MPQVKHLFPLPCGTAAAAEASCSLERELENEWVPAAAAEVA
jgi:hypothetical protein